MSKRFRWGILGCADICRAIVPAVESSDGGCVYAIASRSEARAREFAAAHSIPRAYGSYEELISAREIDALYIPLPNSLHAEWTIRALEAGIPVLCEKPIALSAAEAEMIASAARRAKLPAAEAFMYRFHPVYEKILDIIRSGRIGRITTIRSVFTFMLDDRGSIAAKQELGGGALMDVGCYCVNFSRMIAGSEPIRAGAFARMGEVDDTLIGMLEFPGGILAHFETSIENFERHGAEIAGTAGSISLGSPWIPGAGPVHLSVRTSAGDEGIHIPGADCYKLEVEDFMRACRDGAEPRWPIEDAVMNMRAIDMLKRALGERGR